MKKGAEERGSASKKVAGISGNYNLSTTIAVLALGWIVIYTDRLSISPLLNIIREEFSLSFSATSFVYFAYFIGYIGFTIPATIAASKFGYKKIMVIFMLLAALSLAVAGIEGFIFSLLVLFIGVHGASAGAYYPTAYTISTDCVPPSRRGFASALINSGMGFGTILGLVVSGPVLVYFSNWQAMLLILAVPTVLITLVLQKYVPNTRAPSIGSQASSGKDRSSYSSFNASDYAKVLKNKSFIAISSAMFCSLYGYWVILTWAPTFLQSNLHLAVSPSGEATALFSAIAIPSSIILSRHSDRIGRKKIALTLLPLAALTIFFMAYSTSLYEFLAAAAVYGVIGKLSLDPIALAWIQDITSPNLLGPSLAMLNVIAVSASIFAAFITGIIGDLTGSLSGGFYLGGIVVFLGAVFFAFAKNKPTSPLSENQKST